MSQHLFAPVCARRAATSALSDHITAELHHYDEHLRDVRGLAEGTAATKFAS